MNRHRDRAPDRRAEERVAGSGLSARVRPGHRLIVIDLSGSGALVEARRPLRPGAYVDLHLESAARGGMVAARVTRCAVAAIDAETGVTYRAALSFNESCDRVREALTPEGYDFPLKAAAAAVVPAGGGDPIPRERDDDRQGQTKVPK
jgi:hypothetical protein